MKRTSECLLYPGDRGKQTELTRKVFFFCLFFSYIIQSKVSCRVWRNLSQNSTSSHDEKGKQEADNSHTHTHTPDQSLSTGSNQVFHSITFRCLKLTEWIHMEKCHNPCKWSNLKLIIWGYFRFFSWVRVGNAPSNALQTSNLIIETHMFASQDLRMKQILRLFTEHFLFREVRAASRLNLNAFVLFSPLRFMSLIVTPFLFCFIYCFYFFYLKKWE